MISNEKTKLAFVDSALLLMAVVGRCRVCVFVRVWFSTALLYDDNVLVGDTSVRVSGRSMYTETVEERIFRQEDCGLVLHGHCVVTFAGINRNGR